MSHFDVFNGDADGICALQQLRLQWPRDSVLVTGVKRDIELVARVPARAGDSMTVLDVSLHRNRDALIAQLARGVEVEYIDHHFSGEPLSHPLLRLHLDPAPAACTSAIVDRLLEGRHRLWAVVGAFGDNMGTTAHRLGEAAGLEPRQLQALRELGEAINYNAYGDSPADLMVAPARLYQALRAYANPLDFLEREPLARALGAHRTRDLAQALAMEPTAVLSSGVVYTLPDAAWARRVQGVFANALAQREPSRAHAVLRPAGAHGFAVSVRAPLAAPHGADRLCLAFPTGGGRAAAAGIDMLPASRVAEFIAEFGNTFDADC